MTRESPAIPRWVFVPAALALTLLLLPLVGLLSRVPWARLVEILSTPMARDALRVSVTTSAVALVLAVILGFPLAFVLARARGPWTLVARVVSALPMVLPPVVAGLALLVTFGRRGLVGATFSAWGIEIGFTTVAVVLAQVFVALPYFVVSVEGALRTLDADYERVAASLGARPGFALRHVTIPLLAPALVSGAALAAARALGEFGATLTFAGSLQGVTMTLPQAIYLQREIDPDSALALSVVLLGMATVLVALTALGQRWGWRRG